jgi:two-component system, sensor histidine kinase PdtaS
MFPCLVFSNNQYIVLQPINNIQLKTNLDAANFYLMLMRTIFTCFFLFVLIPKSIFAQPNRLPANQQRLLLELSSGFYSVLSLGQISMDSSLIAASTWIKLPRTPVILDGLENEFKNENTSWLEKRDPVSAKIRLTTLKDVAHMKMLLLIGEYYSFQSGKSNDDADSALVYLFKAKKESEQLKSRFWLNQIDILIAKSYLKQRNTNKGEFYTKMVIQNCRATQDRATLAKACYYYATYCPFIPDTTALRISRLETSARIYHELKDPTREIISDTYFTYLTFAAGDVPRSTKGALHTLALQDSIKFPYTQFIQDQLSCISEATGDHITMLIHALSEVDVSERTKLDFEMSLFYARLGSAYEHLDSQDPKADYYFKKALNAAIDKGGLSIGYDLVFSVTWRLLQQNKADESFRLINSFVSKYPPNNPSDKQTVFIVLGYYYVTINNKAEAEKKYLAAVALENDAVKITNIQAGRSYYQLGHFYTDMGEYAKAKPYLEKYIANTTHTVPDLTYASQAQKDLSKIDSAAGNFTSAFQHLVKHVDLYDKIYNSTQLKALENLKIKYETREKEQSIKLLEAKGSTDRAELQKVGLQRNLTFGGVLALVLVSGLAYNGYRNKKRSNLLLNAQQREINEKNSSLERTLTEKDNLLSDKDLLLKEVNHRVKNNLHIVMSLLDSQSAYLNNNAAIAAIQDSQNRVHSIALIHQKLYSSENITQVDMQSYIPELIDYLNESINGADNKVVITHHIASIMLDVSQAIPVGIILNESITNSIKYSFPDKKKGEIRVNMSSLEDTVKLEVMDNGAGLPPDFDITKARSLGMNLIKGLTNQLKGQFSIVSDKGVIVTIEFKIEAIGILST